MNCWAKGICGVLAALVIAGCGGEGVNPGPDPSGGTATYAGQIDSNSPVMDDGTRYVQLNLIASKSGDAQITASSQTFGVLLVVEKLDTDGTSEVVAEDDGSAGASGSGVVVQAETGGQYTVIATSDSADAAGSVTVSYPSATLGVDSSRQIARSER